MRPRLSPPFDNISQMRDRALQHFIPNPSPAKGTQLRETIRSIVQDVPSVSIDMVETDFDSDTP